MARSHFERGFTLVETLVAMMLVAVAISGLALGFVSSSKFGVLSRRQANAVALARSIAGQLSRAPYTDARLANNNNQNDSTFADPNGVFGLASLPPSGDPNAPDSSLGTFNVGSEAYSVYVNIAPLMDPVNVTLEQGRQFAVIVRYQVGIRAGTNEGAYRRAVVLGYRYNPANVGVGQIPL
jgi:prepilin-type N-terminal cleavage/methylation domain-containing protein